MTAFLERSFEGKVDIINIHVDKDGVASVTIHHSGKGSPLLVRVPPNNFAVALREDEKNDQ